MATSNGKKLGASQHLQEAESGASQMADGQSLKKQQAPSAVINTVRVGGAATNDAQGKSRKQGESGAQQDSSDNEHEEEYNEDMASDDEDSVAMLRLESGVSLPRAPVKQLIMEKLPKEARIHQHSKDLISELCMYFLMSLAEQANEVCSAQKKKTVCPDHVLDALAKMNLTRYYAQMTGQDPSQLGPSAKPKSKPGRKSAAQTQQPATSGPDFQSLKSAIMARLNQSMDNGFKLGRSGRSRAQRDARNDDGMTDEQRNLQQEQLFEDARMRYNEQQEKLALEAAKANEQMGHAQPNQEQPGAYYGAMEGHVEGSMGEMPMEMGPDAYMPVYNPTDYIRDQIFGMDFMGDIPVPDGNQQMTPEKVEDGVAEEEVRAAQEAPLLEEGFSFEPEDLLELETAQEAEQDRRGEGRELGGGAGKQQAGSAAKDHDTKPKEQNDQEMVDEEESKQPGQ